ncbi:MAG: hydroxypyruvate isomerase family protein [Arcticibacter sp.]
MNERRSAIKTILAGAATLTTLSMTQTCAASTTSKEQLSALKGNINHSVCRWCFNDMSLDELCKVGKGLGLKAIDLVGPKEWDVLEKYDLDSSMCNGAEISLTEGWNTVAYHERLIDNYADMIPRVAKAGYKNLICFSGNRRGMDDETGLKNCVTGIKKVLSLAEKHGVVLVMELLNSKLNHKDYQCDRTAWGAELAQALHSENFKLLYDIYHMQVNEGDVIQNIRDYHPFIAHYHTAGVPGRHEIDETQELYYPAIMKAIKETGFKGYVAQEFIPSQPDKIASLRKAIQICDI